MSIAKLKIYFQLYSLYINYLIGIMIIMLYKLRVLLSCIFLSMTALWSWILQSPVFASHDCPEHHQNTSHTNTIECDHHKQSSQILDCAAHHTCDCCTPHIFQVPYSDFTINWETYQYINHVDMCCSVTIIYYDLVYLDISQPPD